MDNTTKNKMTNSNDLLPTLQDYIPIIWRGKWILFFTILLAVNGVFFLVQTGRNLSIKQRSPCSLIPEGIGCVYWMVFP
jgi:hypothetical protein